MNLIERIQDLISSLTGSAENTFQNMSENLPSDQLQNLSDSATNMTESANGKIEEVKKTLGL